MNQKRSTIKKPGDKDENGYAIPHYIIHGGPELSEKMGLPSSQCQYFDDQPNSEEHRKNLGKMWKRWEQAGAKHIYPDSVE